MAMPLAVLAASAALAGDLGQARGAVANNRMLVPAYSARRLHALSLLTDPATVGAGDVLEYAVGVPAVVPGQLVTGAEELALFGQVAVGVVVVAEGAAVGAGTWLS